MDSLIDHLPRTKGPAGAMVYLGLVACPDLSHGDHRVSQAEGGAADLADLVVASGEARLFSVSVYLNVHAPIRSELAEAVAKFRPRPHQP